LKAGRRERGNGGREEAGEPASARLRAAAAALPVAAAATGGSYCGDGRRRRGVAP